MSRTSHPAGAFKARGTPHIMRLHEIMGIEANRRWGVCSLNDFRKVGHRSPSYHEVMLTIDITPSSLASSVSTTRILSAAVVAHHSSLAYATFLEWNSDPDVARVAEKLYGQIDRLELYPGLQAEEAKPVMEGAGLCPCQCIPILLTSAKLTFCFSAYTISRAILSDAIALTRGDRFFTADYTPYNMTAWGFADCQRDASAPGYGSTLGRLFMRALPNQFKADSTYTWFPLMTPEAMKIVLSNLGDDKLYDLSKPTTLTSDVAVTTYEDVAQVLGSTSFIGHVKQRTAKVIEGNG